MKTLQFLFFFGSACLSTIFLQAQLPKAYSTKLDAVHVYRSGADISRSGNISLTEGVHAIYLPDIAENTDETLIHLSLPSGAIVTRMEYRELGPDEKPVVDFEDYLKKLKIQQSKVDGINREINAIKGDFEFLRLNQQINTAGTTTAAQIQQADTYFAKRRRALANELDKLNLELEKEQQELQSISLIVNEKRYSHINNKKVVYAEVKCSKTINGKLQLKYFTSSAGWDPEYVVKSAGIGQEIQFTMEAVIDQSTGEDWKNSSIVLSTGNPALVTALPNIPIWYVGPRQSYVPLPSSVAIPSSRIQTKTIDGYVFDLSTSEEIFQAVVSLQSGNQVIQRTSTNADGYYQFHNVKPGYYTILVDMFGFNSSSTSTNTFSNNSLVRLNLGLGSIYRDKNELAVLARGYQVLESADIQNTPRDSRFSAISAKETMSNTRLYEMSISGVEGVQVNSNDNRPVIQIPQEFKLAQKVTIPGNGDPQRTVIKEEKATGNYYHRCRPALNEHVFIQAEIPNQSTLGFLDGPGRVYFNDAYVGTIGIKANCVSDTMIVDFGRDQNVIVKRERIKMNKSQGFFSSKINEEFNYKIQIRNSNAQAINLIVQDQLPVSTSPEIKVSPRELSGGIINPESSVVKWSSTLESGKDKSILFSFEVLYPKDAYINLPK